MLTAGQQLKAIHESLERAEADYARCVQRIEQHRKQMAEFSSDTTPGHEQSIKLARQQQDATLRNIEAKRPALVYALITARMAASAVVPHLAAWSPDNVLASIDKTVPGPEHVVEKIVERLIPSQVETRLRKLVGEYSTCTTGRIFSLQQIQGLLQ